MTRTLVLFLAITIAVVPGYAKTQDRPEAIVKSILDGSIEESAPPTEQKKTVKPAAKADAKPEVKAGAKQPAVDAAQSRPARAKKEKSEDKLQPLPPDEVLLRTGIQLYTSGLYDAALVKFREIKAKYPESQFTDKASMWIGRIHLNAGKLDEAIKEFGTVPEDRGEYPASLYFIGDTSYRKGSTPAAIEHLVKLSAQFPEHELADDAYLLLGTIYLNEGKGGQALESATKIAKYYSKRETIDDAYFLMGQVFEKDPGLRDLESARRIYQIFLKKAREDKEPNFQNSPLLMRVEKDLRAIESTYFKMEN
ncbi:MAG: outer membrane protein assembly factor BamD [Spirochaetes bacterium]|nr:MAG: outer membrane protein assembly factor BamD [Spirochaetota bacterium]